MSTPRFLPRPVPTRFPLLACVWAVVTLRPIAATATEPQLRTYTTDPGYISPMDAPRVLGGEVAVGSLGAGGTLQQGLEEGRSRSLRHMMTPVKDQGRRGTCTAFATIAIFEAMFGNTFSEQCLSKVGTEDGSTVFEQFNRIFHGALYTEAACPYDDSNRDVVPADWPRGGRAAGMALSGDRFSPGDGKDIVFYVKRNIDQGMLVAAGIHVVGDWWRDFASVPMHLPTGPYSSVRIGEFGDYMDIPIRAKVELRPHRLTDLSPLRSYFYGRSSLHVRQSLQYDSTEKDGRSVSLIRRDFDDFVRSVRPVDVPSEEEVVRECSDLVPTASRRCGRHAIVITGYDDAAGALEFRNSWGPDWKQSGYGYMTYAYLRRFHANGANDGVMVSAVRERVLR